MKWFTVISLLILTILCSTGIAVEEHVLMLDGQKVRFTAVPEEGYIQRTEEGRQKTEVRKSALNSTQPASAKVTYQAPLFSVNGQKVGVTPEIVVRVTGDTSREDLETLCDTMGMRLLKPMPFTTREYVLEVIGPDAEAVFTAVKALNEIESAEWAWPNLMLWRKPDPVAYHSLSHRGYMQSRGRNRS